MSNVATPPVKSTVSPSFVHPAHKVFSLSRVCAIASNTLLGLVRQKVFYFLLIFALVLIGSSAFMINFTFQEQFQVLKDVSLGAMSIFTWLLSVQATAMLLPKDIEDRTLYTILAKPVPRFEYLLGKLLGVLGLLLISTLVMSGLFMLVLYIREGIEVAKVIAEVGGGQLTDQAKDAIATIKASTFSWSLLPGIVALYLKAALFASLTLLISTFASSSIFTIVTSVAIYFIGSIQSIARDYWTATDLSPVTEIFLKLIVLIFPDLQLFNLVDDIVAGNVISGLIFLKTVLLGGIYVLVYLFLAYFIFSNKEL